MPVLGTETQVPRCGEAESRECGIWAPFSVTPSSDGWRRVLPAGPLKRRALLFLAEMPTQGPVGAVFSGETVVRERGGGVHVEPRTICLPWSVCL